MLLPPVNEVEKRSNIEFGAKGEHTESSDVIDDFAKWDSALVYDQYEGDEDVIEEFHGQLYNEVKALYIQLDFQFEGLSLGLDLSSTVGVGRRRGSGLVVRAGKAALCLTKRSRSRKSLARTHGFRRRMRTTGGRAMMKRRRAKGRKVLCTKSNPNSGKRA
ncbi:50S ribosomal protein L34, chloroplastic-like [Pyrus x bretschneideri]|uniref:50S ribosomal protein L34, chloroplastic-like n=1 Tax=Pyrus x bretschneideri TaxID=225117 RepID=UPI00202E0BA6|nr:50S ribosomal protein L34, chloroplastic-like [Pyrus x bretschneideri]